MSKAINTSLVELHSRESEQRASIVEDKNSDLVLVDKNSDLVLNITVNQIAPLDYIKYSGQF